MRQKLVNRMVLLVALAIVAFCWLFALATAT
jgi:hypothetical protein